LVLRLLGISIAATTHAEAQTAVPPLPRVVYISSGDETGARPFVDSFRQGMRELGQKEDSTFRLEILYANRDPTRTPGLIRDAVASRPAVLVVLGLLAVRHARDATRSVPVVVATSSDLVDAGVVSSYARPGGNITGLNDLSDELAAKRLELIKETLPKASHVVLLVNPDFPATQKIERRVRAAARTLGIEVSRLDAKDPASLVMALDSLATLRPDALLLGGGALFVVRARELIDRARVMRVPVIHYWPGTAEMGALFSHQADIFYNFQRAAYYVDRILKGAKPGNLAIEQPTRYELVVNKKVATEFGLTIPPALILRADRVIE
jgi:putative ABC transport system substrate-binding protein